MSAASSSTGDLVKVLLLGSEAITANIKWPALATVTQSNSFFKYVYENISSTDIFELIIPCINIKEVMDDPIYHMEQIRHIHPYYDSEDDLNRDKVHIKDEQGKLRFCLAQNLPRLIQKLKADNAINSSRSNYRETLNDFTGSSAERILVKRSSPADYRIPAPKHIASELKRGLSVKNIEQIDSHYICPFCNLILRDPYQLECGHRLCQCCIKNENDQTLCLNCSDISLNSNIRRDRGFCNDMARLPVTCLLCDWTGLYGNYEKHIDQNHFSGENAVRIVDVYAQRTEQSTLGEFVHTAETHEQIMSDILSASRSVYMPNNSNEINNHGHILLEHLQEFIDFMSNHVNMLHNDLQRLDTELRRSQTSIQAINQNGFSVNRMLEDITSHADGLKISQDLYAQQIWSLKQDVDNVVPTYYDGTYIWKITEVQEKIADAQSERQKSIYSPPFYSSPTGYKMCLRLYLNGDADTHNTHLSLFLVIMRNHYDAILKWPFGYKVLFRLIDQSTLNDRSGGIIHAFAPDIRSDCFKRPQSNMNSAHGFKNFLSISALKQHQGVYIAGDTMLIEAKIDFGNENWSLSTLTRGSPNDEEHIGGISEDFMHMS